MTPSPPSCNHNRIATSVYATSPWPHQPSSCNCNCGPTTPSTNQSDSRSTTPRALRGDLDGLDRDSILGLVTATDPERFEPTIVLKDISDETAFRVTEHEVIGNPKLKSRRRSRDSAEAKEHDDERISGGKGEAEFTRRPSPR